MVARGGRRLDWLIRLLPVVMLPLAVLLNTMESVPDLGLPLFAATPLIVATFFSPRAGAVTAGICLVVVTVLDVARGRSFVETTVDILAVGLVNAIGVWVAHVARQRETDLGVARRIAEFAQNAVLPRPPAHVGRLRCDARYRPALSEARVGGDFYGIAAAPTGVRAMIGDVRGKGVEAVAAVAVAVGAFREHAEDAESLAELAARIDRALVREDHWMEETAALEGFSTVLLVEVDTTTNTARLLNFGHTEPYLVTAERVVRAPLGESWLPLGSGLGDPRTAGPPREVPFPPGTALLLLTDGVTEARNAERRFFDPELHMPPTATDDPVLLADVLVERVGRWTGGARQDDMALLVLTHAVAEPEPRLGSSVRSAEGPAGGTGARVTDGK
ncbi:serine/threonine-protein phosphatase [Streptomyces sp. XM4193]|uniref:PP2C family protein-serine/threonine phosphatase n=1 Tax=Streptomyces sp. XM4193 TaxID=2929782 RepID=UPI001FF97397|nr:PP2C family protein-serine/threonine phosphatase [Streptomyces sp. XM4193]MCK1795852.1 serine/threonine-protein phosphatase [Streptomyces sp. XM4193]